jgi:prevent-host-death family protein
MNLKEAVRPITHLKTHTAEAVREVAEKGRPMVVTQNGEAKAVLMDIATYDRWRSAMALLKLIAHGQRDVEHGKTVSQEEAFARARARVARSSTRDE